MSPNRTFVVAAGVLALVAVLVFHLLGYVDLKGFNPSDDGVILAQSYRILQGQVPHRDFITIRPALSGLLHTIHFFSPFPIVESGRIIVLIEIFVGAFVWAWVLCIIFLPGGGLVRSACLFSALGIIAFVLGLHSNFLFPWTTIDAIFFTLLGFALILSGAVPDIPNLRRTVLLAGGLFLTCLAMLCRQSFTIMVLGIAALCAVVLIRSGRPQLLGIVLPVGLLPAILYLGMLVVTGAWGQFCIQMSGRNQLFAVGVMSYARNLIFSFGGGFHFLVALMAIYVGLKRNWRRLGNSRVDLAAERSLLWKMIMAGYAVFAVLLPIVRPDTNGFEMFWGLGALVLAACLVMCCTFAQRTVLLFALVLSWTGSISIGANSPVLCIGLIATVILALAASCLVRWHPSFVRGAKGLSCCIALAGAAVFLAPLEISRQLDRNYRDLPSSELTHDLGRLLPAFGQIRTNAWTYGYYQDLLRLYNTYSDMKDHLVVVPNNAILYPVLGTYNPFPLDWPQQEEFPGLEAQVLARMAKVLGSEKIYVLIEKCNSKKLDRGIQAAENIPERYPYMDLLAKTCPVLDDNSPYFTLRMSRPSAPKKL